MAISPANTAIKQKIANAEADRQKIVSACMNGTGSAALAACDSGLLKGAPDEAAIHSRRGDLLVAKNQEQKALEEYRLALRLDPGNSAAKQAINSLTAVKKAVVRPAPTPSPSPSPRRTPPPPEPALVFSNAPISAGITY